MKEEKKYTSEDVEQKLINFKCFILDLPKQVIESFELSMSMYVSALCFSMNEAYKNNGESYFYILFLVLTFLASLLALLGENEKKNESARISAIVLTGIGFMFLLANRG